MKVLTISGFAQDPDLISKELNLNSVNLDYHQILPKNIRSYLTKYSNPDIIYAWSLGSLIAINNADILKPKRLVLYSPIYQYLESDTYPYGISKNDFENFSQKLKNNEDKFTKYFSLLIAKNANNERDICKKLRKYDISKLKYKTEWLNYLANTQANLDNIKNIDTEIYHGKMDNIVSYKQSEFIKEKLTHIKLNLLPGVSHYCFDLEFGADEKT